MQQKCHTCHRPGEVAPFSLLTYQDASPHVRDIEHVIETGEMPPWRPVVGDFENDRRLEPGQKETLLEWIATGASEGNPDDLPPPLQFNLDWTLGQPDLVLTHPAYTPNPEDEDDYRCFSVPTNLLAEKKIRAVEIRPGNGRIAHHVILYGDPTGATLALDNADEGAGYSCFGDAGIDLAQIYGGWAPGNRPQVLPAGTSQTIPAASRISIQVHYHPDGTLQSDETRVGIYFTEEESTRNLAYFPLVNQSFSIPPGETNFEVTAGFTNPFPGVTLYAVLPHMHLLGRRIGVEITRPGEPMREIIRIDDTRAAGDWDFEWQDTYWMREPLDLLPGTRAALRAFYDNSASNPRNPNDPPVAVGWGNGSNDEMALAFLLVSVPAGLGF